MCLTRLFGLIGGVLTALAALPAAAERPSEKADALLAGLIETNDPGLAVLVAQDGKILFEKGYGLADREHDIPVTPQTIFRIGSVTKQFTASAILKLHEEGKLSVDDKLSKYFPDFPRGNEVTLRQLLTHTSGIHDYTEDADVRSRMNSATTPEAIIGAIKKEPYDFEPGTKWRYSNSGYRLLGYIVEKVSGQSYGDFLRENFFQPLGMTNASVYHALHLPHEALGYTLGTNGFTRALNEDPSWAGGDWALHSTVEDLFHWNEGVFNDSALDAASLKAAFTPVKMLESQINSDSGYGFGWFINRYRGLPEIWHAGDRPGFRNMLLRLPDEKFTVAILRNSGPGRPNTDPLRLARQLTDIFLADKIAPQLIANTNVSPNSYDALTGRYELDGKILTVSKHGLQLFGQRGDYPEAEIFPESETEFFAKVEDAQFTFVKDSGGKTVKLIVHQNGSDMVALRVKDIAEAQVDPAVYDRLVGRYDYGKLRVLRVTRDGNHLFAQFAGRNCEIFPKSETEYFWKEMDAQVTFVKDGRGKVTKAIYHQGNKTIIGRKITSLERFWLSLYARWFGAAALLYAFYIGIGVSIRDRVPFQIMRESFYSLPRNFAACFNGWKIAGHFAAIGLGVVLVTSGFDWFYLSVTRSPQLLAWMIPGIDLGVWVPLALPPLLLLAGMALKRATITRTGWALAQVALIGLVLTELIKAVTGRPQPPFFMGPDTSQVFHFGLLRSEMVSGWPSGHTIIAFAMSVTLFWLFPQKKWLGAVSLLYAFYVGLSVSMTVHWFSDFASGILFGIVVGTTVGRSFAAMDFPSRRNGIQDVPQVVP